MFPPLKIAIFRGVQLPALSYRPIPTRNTAQLPANITSPTARVTTASGTGMAKPPSPSISLTGQKVIHARGKRKVNSICAHRGQIVIGYMDTRSNSSPTMSVKLAVLLVQKDIEPQNIHTAPRIMVPPARMHKTSRILTAVGESPTFAQP